MGIIESFLLLRQFGEVHISSTERPGAYSFQEIYPPGALTGPVLFFHIQFSN